jgi:hypothetical protein
MNLTLIGFFWTSGAFSGKRNSEMNGTKWATTDTTKATTKDQRTPRPSLDRQKVLVSDSNRALPLAELSLGTVLSY